MLSLLHLYIFMTDSVYTACSHFNVFSHTLYPLLVLSTCGLMQLLGNVSGIVLKGYLDDTCLPAVIQTIH